jgi:hypothetical protein
MLLPTRPIAVSTAVLCFFAIGIIGTLGGLSPFTCSKRAVVGAAIIYVVTTVAVRAIGAILTQAMITDRIRKEHAGDNKD